MERGAGRKREGGGGRMRGQREGGGGRMRGQREEKNERTERGEE